MTTLIISSELLAEALYEEAFITGPTEVLECLKLWRDKDEMIKLSSIEGSGYGLPSNSELRRWLKAGSVLINGRVMQVGDIVSCPILELVFFSVSARESKRQAWTPPKMYL